MIEPQAERATGVKNTVFAILLAASPGIHADAQAQASTTSSQRTILDSDAFLSSHPDLLHRQMGNEQLKLGKERTALQRYRMAARYGDKPSQALVAAMHWEGRGTSKDRATAYAWADLAAERGYPQMVAQREAYWSQLSESERARALAVGRGVYAEYGDEVAEPRLANALRRATKESVGARTGRPAAGYAQRIHIFLPGGASGDEGGGADIAIDSSQFHAEKFWNPAQYRAWQDAQWKPERVGKVEVGDLHAVPSRVKPDAAPKTQSDPPPHR